MVRQNLGSSWPVGWQPVTMLNEILPSDVEFAQGMVNSSRSDPEILSFLTSRGVPPDKAAQLLDDLRHGRKPVFVEEYALGSTARRTPHKSGRHEARVPQEEVSIPSHSRHRKHKRSGGAWWFVLLIIVFLWAVWYAFFKTGADASRDVIDMDKHTIPTAPNKEPER
jgi:hypothetical protein